jgi:hypothetical protein
MKRRQIAILGLIMVFVALGAIPAGISLILKPDGTGLRMSLDYLKDSPFKDFFIPGLFLLIVNGLLNVAGTILCFMRNKHAAILGLLLGIALLLWIVIQVYSIGLVSFMQPLFFCIGLAEILLSAGLIRKDKQSTGKKREGYIVNRPLSGYQYPDEEEQE